MSSPARRTRSSMRQPIPTLTPPLETTPALRRSPRRAAVASRVPSLAPSEAPSIPVRRSPRRVQDPPKLPPLQNRISSAYGGQGRTTLAEEITPNIGLDLTTALDNIRAGKRYSTPSNPSHHSSRHTSHHSSPRQYREMSKKSATRSPSARAATPATPSATNNNNNIDNIIDNNVDDNVDNNNHNNMMVVTATEATVDDAENDNANNNDANSNMGPADFTEHLADTTSQIGPVYLRPFNRQSTPRAFSRASSEENRDDEVPSSTSSWLSLYKLLAMLLPLLVLLSLFYYRADSFSISSIGSLNLSLPEIPTVSLPFHRAMPQASSPLTETKIQELANRVTLLDETVDELKEILPPIIVVYKNDDDDFDLPQEFWPALKDKIARKTDQTIPTPLWDEFVKANDFYVKHLHEKLNAAYPRKNAQSVLGRLHLFHTEEIISLLKDNYIALHNEITKVDTKLQQQIKEAMDGCPARESGSAPHFQIERMAKSNILMNAETAIRKFDFFSPKQGTRVDPYLTSEKFLDPNDGPVQRWYKWFNKLQGHPPIAALTPWTEAGDCFCAAPYSPPRRLSNLYGVFGVWSHTDPAFHADGRPRLDSQGPPVAQLATRLGRRMLPRSLTVEHIPSEGTLDPDAAPKWMELWVESLDPAIREEVSRASESLYTRLEKRVTRSSRRNEGIKIPSTYVLISKFRYDRNSDNHIQNFPVDVNIDVHGATGIRNAIVRVINNWGADHTCLYRVKLHGDLA